MNTPKSIDEFKSRLEEIMRRYDVTNEDGRHAIEDDVSDLLVMMTAEHGAMQRGVVMVTCEPEGPSGALVSFTLDGELIHGIRGLWSLVTVGSQYGAN